jgi:glycosyltransferase involved in cell wall biosynthesis
MNILIASWTPQRREGGVAGVIWNLKGALESRGHRVDCLFLEDILPSPVGPARFESTIFAWRLARRVWRDRGRYDVVNLHAPTGFVYGLMRRTFWRGGPPYVMTMHGLEERRAHAMRREARKGRAWHFRWMNRMWHRIHHQPQFSLAIRTGDQAIVLNREAWSYLQLGYGRDAADVSYIPNGVEERFFLPREYPREISPRLLFVGSWLDHKGIFYLRDALTILAGRLPELSVTIAGCSASKQAVRDFFPVDVQSRISVLPFVESSEMPGIYAAHDIFVFPSLMEGLPLVLLEAMATGMPVITTETCGMADVVRDGVNGLLVPPADAEAVADAVLHLAESADLRKQLGRAAQEGMHHYTWDRIAKRVERVFIAAVREQSHPQLAAAPPEKEFHR